MNELQALLDQLNYTYARGEGSTVITVGELKSILRTIILRTIIEESDEEDRRMEHIRAGLDSPDGGGD